jgi:hypothetical protein
MTKTVIDLQSTSTHVSLFMLPALTKIKSGTVTLTVTSKNRPVQIDALGVAQG